MQTARSPEIRKLGANLGTARSKNPKCLLNNVLKNARMSPLESEMFQEINRRKERHAGKSFAAERTCAVHDKARLRSARDSARLAGFGPSADNRANFLFPADD
jgi:hypothetical protein